MLSLFIRLPRLSLRCGFSLIELMTSVAIIGILTAVAVPVYSGYIDSTRASIIKDRLRAIHMQQQEYFSMANRYFATGESCDGDERDAINATLFSGDNILQETDTDYCITQENTDDFTAIAVYDNDGNARTWSIDHQGNSNF